MVDVIKMNEKIARVGPEKEPEIGDIYYLMDGSPWLTLNKAKIIDVSDGWVRYTTAVQEYRKPIKDFLRLYNYGSNPE
jgi:hypothetical protein